MSSIDGRACLDGGAGALTTNSDDTFPILELLGLIIAIQLADKYRFCQLSRDNEFLAYVCTALRPFPCLRVEGFIYVPRSIALSLPNTYPLYSMRAMGAWRKGNIIPALNGDIELPCVLMTSLWTWCDCLD